MKYINIANRSAFVESSVYAAHELPTGNTMPLTHQDIMRQLRQQNHVLVPFALPSTVIHDAMAAFFRFLDEPPVIREHIDFTIAPLHRRGDVGFKQRHPGDDIYNDSKAFFHFHPAIFQRYGTFLTQQPVVNDFMLKAEPVWQAVASTVHALLTTLQPPFPGLVHRVFDTPDVHILLRFLKYNWQQSGKYLAKPHFDAGSMTLAIAESGPGLRIGSGPHDLTPVQHQPGHAIFMLSSNFKQLMPADELTAGWHDVIQLDETFIGKPYSRWALVAFIEAHGVTALPRTETHKWFQGETGPLN
ncbi:hypothetical protein GH742_05220 [Legionella sp. MW5194]|uniref:hypothetical protein n=1 Tax=Legionella sp. MW5194 TaxID=2662448 RepID=UPI00193E0860|nr:hypothetical protein [Legionella sp. MW5194]QRN03313.1 hypothetical protein GH742_05220 [Legionella sp. MW5194]